MSTATKSLAKSLHTVSVLVAVATALRPKYDTRANFWVLRAVIVLGYGDANDPHDLIGRATRQLLCTDAHTRALARRAG